MTIWSYGNDQMKSERVQSLRYSHTWNIEVDKGSDQNSDI